MGCFETVKLRACAGVRTMECLCFSMPTERPSAAKSAHLHNHKTLGSYLALMSGAASLGSSAAAMSPSGS